MGERGSHGATVHTYGPIYGRSAAVVEFRLDFAESRSAGALGRWQWKEIRLALHLVDHDGAGQALQGGLRLVQSGQAPRTLEFTGAVVEGPALQWSIAATDGIF